MLTHYLVLVQLLFITAFWVFGFGNFNLVVGLLRCSSPRLPNYYRFPSCLDGSLSMSVPLIFFDSHYFRFLSFVIHRLSICTMLFLLNTFQLTFQSPAFGFLIPNFVTSVTPKKKAGWWNSESVVRMSNILFRTIRIEATYVRPEITDNI